jgi:ribosome-binding protein aMBF1 (putative translation factor)
MPLMTSPPHDLIHTLSTGPKIAPKVTDVRRDMGTRILLKRQSKGLSQSDVAAKMDLSDAAISMWEKGKTEPSIAKFIHLANILGTTPEYLAFGIEFRRQ